MINTLKNNLHNYMRSLITKLIKIWVKSFVDRRKAKFVERLGETAERKPLLLTEHTVLLFVVSGVVLCEMQNKS